MSQSIHFARLKYFSEEFTKDRNYGDILHELKKILGKEENIDETLDGKFTEDIELKYPSLNAYDKIQEFLKTGSEIQLHSRSRFYFVNEEIWKVIEEAIFRESKQIKMKEDFFDLAEDYITIKGYFNKKMLVFDAS
ncbi:hypothetical protein BMF77_01054 [Dolichospermum sp. UHCC 0315A]|jgi:hypothetical protein|uniref:hypothetical protein n=1 Tax=Dolichospermum sp. UHCC 0315A TaxID=1914871 RepID=UPI0011E6EECA|nr:hypothetical protein [Dolichospermum sp. UHCC 0315A]QEI40485.1 hypothetical protein BMF77_01054 [Dolichospermum sp. UHCC 0315A]